MKTRMLAFLLVFCVLLGALAGCNKAQTDPVKPSDSDNSGSNKPSGAQTSDASQQTSAKYVYTADYVPLTLDVNSGYISPLCVSGNYLYLTAEITLNIDGTVADPGVADDGMVDDGMTVMPRTMTETAASPDEPAAEEAASEDGISTQDDPAIDTPIADEPVADEPVADEPIDGANGTEPYTYETRLYRVDLTTGEASQLSDYVAPAIPDGYTGYTSINRVLPGSNGSIWIYDTMDCYSFVQDEENPDNGGNYIDGPSSYRLQQFSADGKLLQTVDMTREQDSDSNRNFNFIDSKDQLYFNDWSTGNVTVESLDGKVLKTLEIGDGWLTTFCDRAAIQTYKDGKQDLCVIDPDTLELGDPVETPANGWGFITSYDEAYDFYYQYNSDLYGYKQKEQVSELVVSWMDCDIDSNYINATYALEDGRILGILNENGGGGATVYDAGMNALGASDGAAVDTGYTLVFLTKTDAASVKPKTVLTLACMYLDWNLRSRIVEFNKNSEDYRIIIKDYSQYATDDDYNAGVTKLNTEILSGQVPDLLYTYNMPISQYAAQGILVDLKPYIEADSELSGDALMTHILDAASIDGKLYEAFSNFSINTAVGLTKVVGDYDQWTVKELKDALSKLQPDATVFGIGNTKADMLANCLRRSYAAYVDWSNGTCNFDSDDFRELLEFVNAFPESFDWNNVDWSSTKYDADALKAGTQLLVNTSISALQDYAWTLASFGGQDITYVGYPSATGNNNVFMIGDGLSISSVCKDKDGAWQFVRTLFTEEHQREVNYYGIPTNAALFNEQLKSLMTIEYQTDADGNYILDDNGEKIVNPKATYWFDENNQYEIDVLTQEQIDQIMALYNSTNLVQNDDESIMSIITEETAGYFAGQKTLDDTVRLIQNRVSLYVAESK